MIQLRQVVNENGKLLTLQYRSLNVELNWIDEKSVFTLKPPVSLNMEKNWSEWKDLESVYLEGAKLKDGVGNE